MSISAASMLGKKTFADSEEVYMPNIIKQYTKFIFPFRFNKELVAPGKAEMENKKGVKMKIFEPFTQRAESLREGLDSLLAENGGTAKIADCYQLNINCRKEFCLPPRKNEYIEFISRQSDGESLKVALPEVKLYFFESQVGFAELEFEYESKSLDDYSDTNYFISETKSEKNRFVSYEKVWNEESRENALVKKEFTVQSLLEKLFSYVSKDNKAVSFIYKNSKPLIYSYLLTDEKPSEINELLQHLAKNYKESYKFDDSCTKIKTVHPFENSYWTASLNGVTNLSFKTGDSLTDEFFENNFYTKTKDTYYFLFLNIIHQRHAVTRIMGEMSHLDRLINDYYVMKDQLKLARRYEAEAINLKFRAFFKCPSYVEHVNDYYDMLYNSFQIGQFYDNFSSDMKNLQSICSKYVERIKDREEKLKKRKNAKTEIFVSIFGAIVAEVTLFNNSWSLVEKVLGRSISFWSPGIMILCATLISPMITIVVNVSKKSSEIKLLSSQINTEKKDRLVEDDKERRTRGKFITRLDKFHEKLNKKREKKNKKMQKSK